MSETKNSWGLDMAFDWVGCGQEGLRCGTEDFVTHSQIRFFRKTTWGAYFGMIRNFERWERSNERRESQSRSLFAHWKLDLRCDNSQLEIGCKSWKKTLMQHRVVGDPRSMPKRKMAFSFLVTMWTLHIVMYHIMGRAKLNHYNSIIESVFFQRSWSLILTFKQCLKR